MQEAGALFSNALCESVFHNVHQVDWVELKFCTLCRKLLHQRAVKGNVRKHGKGLPLAAQKHTDLKAKAFVQSDLRASLPLRNAAVNKHDISPTFGKESSKELFV